MCFLLSHHVPECQTVWWRLLGQRISPFTNKNDNLIIFFFNLRKLKGRKTGRGGAGRGPQILLWRFRGLHKMISSVRKYGHVTPHKGNGALMWPNHTIFLYNALSPKYPCFSSCCPVTQLTGFLLFFFLF